MIKKFDNPKIQLVWEYFLITVGILVMTVGVYFFKFPNKFAFGGVTGFSAVISAVTPLSSSQFTFVANMLLLVVGFLMIGRSFGIKTVYASILMSIALSGLESWAPMTAPLTTEPLLELIFAILLPAVGSAILFEAGASSGGTDIIAMILKKYTSINIGTALLLADLLSVTLSFVLFGPATGLFSVLGLLVKSLLLDNLIESMRLCKCFSIVCTEPEPICNFIMNELKHGATVYEAHGAYTHERKTVVMTTLKRGEAVRLKRFVAEVEPSAFMMITNSSEIIGKGFLSV